MRGRLGIPDDAPVVVCTARMVRRKGQDTLVRAWPAVLERFPDARLLLVGDGPDRRRIERIVAGLELAESVVQTGSVPWDDIPAYTDAGDVFAMPCRTRRAGLEAEAFGIVFLEAQACGLPAVIGDSGGAPETLRLPDSRVIRKGSVNEIMAALVDLLRDSREPQSGSVLTEDDWARVASQLGRLLASCSSPN